VEKAGIGLVIFAKNEEKTIGDLIDRAVSYIPRTDIFVMDGHSGDRTASIVRHMGISLLSDERPGKGAAIRQAIRNIDRDILIFMDGDGSHQPEEIPNFIRIFKEDPEIQLVVGSRFKGGSEELNGSPGELMRLAGNKLGTALINLRWRAGLSDVQNGFRAIRRRTAHELMLSENSFAIEQEMIMKCLKKKKRIAEFPSWERKRLHNQSHVIPSKMILPYTRSLLKDMLRR